jgi:peptidoglycan/LPS O-acetylase OafA/YrhL
MEEAVQKLKDFWMPDNLDSLTRESLENLGGKYGNISKECSEGTFKLWNSTDPTTGSPLILVMVDAMGKIGAGVLDGNIYASGAYDECLNIGSGDTEYCTGYVSLIKGVTSPITLVYNMCVPKDCTTYDIMIAILEGTDAYLYSDPVGTSCVSTKKPPYSAGAIIMITVCFSFVILAIAATIFDYVMQLLQEPQTDNAAVSEKAPLLATVPTKKQTVAKIPNFITAFSLLKVLPQILSTKQPPSAITSINGLRVISMFWVILCHTHSWILIVGVQNVGVLKNVLSRFTFQAISNGFFSVDSFFFLSGLLVAYLTFREMKRKKGRFPFLMYYLHRYLRLTPTYAFVLFFVWLLMMYLTNGPTFHLAAWEESAHYQNCEKYWWTNLLYINNLYPWKLDDECLGWTWYLANDMQFYIFSPLIIIPLYFLFPVGLMISAGVLVVSFAISGTLAGVYDHQANEFSEIAYSYTPNNTDTTTYSNLLYIKPWHRVTPYIVGLVLGYVLYRYRLSTKRFINYIIFPMLVILSGTLLALTLYGFYPQWHGHVPTKAENVVYIMFSRFTWSVGLALLVFACHYGFGGPINWFLSMKFWIPLSRVSYNAYLIHPLILTVIFGSERKVMYYEDYNLAIYAVGVVVLSYGAAAVVSIFVEFPIGNLEQALFKSVGLGRRESARTGDEPQKDNTEQLQVDSPTKPKAFIGSSGIDNTTACSKL